MSINLKINKPSLATKQLKLQKCSSGRKLTVSTNWLVLFGFTSGARVKEVSLGKGKGFKVLLVDEDETEKTKKVYQRSYKHRKNNQIETMLDIRSKKLLEESFGTSDDITMAHIVFEYGVITITPITDRKIKAINQFKKAKDKFSSFVACSSGVDISSMKKVFGENNDNFKIETLIEYRPIEKKDKLRDLSETGALNALANCPVKHLINEDLMNLNLDKIAKLTLSSNYTFASISIACTDFSNAKSKSLKDKSLEEGSSTIDMVVDVINIIEKFNFPTLLIENVENFFTSDIGRMLQSRLKRLQYRATCRLPKTTHNLS